MGHSIYTSGTGRIIGFLKCSNHLLELNRSNLENEGMELFDSMEINGSAQWVSDVNTIRPRPANTASIDKTVIAVDGTEMITVSNLPNPADLGVAGRCTLTVDGDNHDVTGNQEVSFALDVAGTYTITVEAFPYYSKTWEVEAI